MPDTKHWYAFTVRGEFPNGNRFRANGHVHCTETNVVAEIDKCAKGAFPTGLLDDARGISWKQLKTMPKHLRKTKKK